MAMPIRPISPLRAAAATVGISTGTTLAVAGPDALVRAGATLIAHAGVILICAAVLLVAGSAVRSGRRLLPVVLAVAGLLLVLAEDAVLWHRYGWPALGSLLVAGGVRIMVATPAPSHPSRRDADTLRRVFAGPFRDGAFRAADAAQTPRHISVVACFGKATVDLRDAAVPRTALVEVFITGCRASVDIIVPDSWPIAAGRVTLTRRVQMRGHLDLAVPVEDPNADFGKLTELVTRKATAQGEGAAVLVHVVGFASSVFVGDASAHEQQRSSSPP